MSATIAEPAAIETRSGTGYQVADVNFPKRLVTVIGMPYERPAEVPMGNRMVTEIVSRGAFDGIEKRAGMIRANRDHNWDKLVGKLVGLHPSRKEGLVADIKIFSTTLGDDTLTLCDEGGLDASAGFQLLRRDDGRVYDDAEVWDRARTTRRLKRLWLDHLSLVPNPAYSDATVLDVRTGILAPVNPAATPNLDSIRLAEQRARYAELNARWPH
jgi:HK97 family phage prohead protease